MRIKRSELKLGKTYKAFSPNGDEIKGTYDHIPGTALASHFTVSETGVVNPEYEGETEIYWDGQTAQVNENNEVLYVCRYGDTWPESELLFEETKE